VAHDPWKAEPLGEGRFRFTNESGCPLGAIAVNPFRGGDVDVENHTGNSPNLVGRRGPGESLIGKVRG
jgi:hypothetical protein